MSFSLRNELVRCLQWRLSKLEKEGCFFHLLYLKIQGEKWLSLTIKGDLGHDRGYFRSWQGLRGLEINE